MIEHIVSDISAAPPEIALEAIRDLLLWDGRDALEALRAPMLAINSDDGSTNVESLEQYGLNVILMPGVGHFVMMEAPDTFNRVLAEAVAEFEKAAAP
jgi:pimeloyl-ACP methyl ester carboxylesterase